ncbi:PD-(D/E)XK nuclease family protein [Burkholderia anthina]|uniref:PDDEXK-like family protein n=2 Tax=Burkholderia cepacia complex TaxID=87882 RepID=UPI000F5E7FFA|nr:PD-(D/E)XK nuclease family protein [Burkholderia anthina]MCA8094506.1 PD-(D/E)XK nuclease family protein [Burkholderia anthina]RRA23365.1 hypothetical protein DF038_11125 [Burkholderia cepacia]
MKSPEQHEIDSFMADADLLAMIEQSKISDDIFDVVNLSETQHSNMLAWCLNPNEGHGQGDAVIKDFLLAAWESSDGSIWDNKAFFEKWRPGKIRTASFGTAFVTREMGVEHEAGQKGRLDLFLVDPINEIVVTIENKLNGHFNPEQLARYRTAVNEQIAKRPFFRNYAFAYVVIDRGLSEVEHPLSEDKRWIVMNYGWLAPAAERASHHLARSNQSARLLMAYCQRHSDDWQSEDERRLIEIAGVLSERHATVVDHFSVLSKEKIKSWTPALKEAPEADLRYFYHQHKHACNALVEARGIAAVATGIRKLQPGLPVQLLTVFRKRLALSNEAALSCQDDKSEDRLLPVYIIVRERSQSSGSERTFSILLLWISSAFSVHAEPDILRNKMAVKFRELSTHASRDRRRVPIASGLNASDAARKAVEVSAEVETMIKKHLEEIAATA